MVVNREKVVHVEIYHTVLDAGVESNRCVRQIILVPASAMFLLESPSARDAVQEFVLSVVLMMSPNCHGLRATSVKLVDGTQQSVQNWLTDEDTT